MTKNWKTVKLGDVCENLDSQRKPIAKKDRTTGKVPYYGATGIVDYVNDYLFDEKLVLLGEDGAKWDSGDACAFIIKGKTWVNNHAHVLRPKRDVITDEWLVYNLNHQDLRPYVSGMTVPKLNQGRMNEISLPLPPLPEQHRIVSILDSAFAAIDKAKANAGKNLQNAKELFESYLQEVFEKKVEGWEKVTLGEVCLFKGGGTPSTKVKKYWEGSIPWVSPKDMKSKVIVDSQDHVSEVALQNSTISLIPKGSVLVVVRSGILSRIVPLGISESEMTINQDLKALCPGKKIDSRFLFYFLESNMRLLLSKVSRGATVHRLTTDSLRDLVIYLPPLSEQKSIVGKVDMIYSKTEELKSKFQRKFEDMDELKRAILQRAFNGELKTIVKELA